MIRGASDLDAADLEAIRRRSFSSSAGPDPVLTRVYVLDGRVAGYCEAITIAGEVRIIAIATDPDLRRRGVARALLEDAMREARTAILQVARDNAAARRLYESAGFEVAGVRRGHWDGGTEVLVMVRRRPRT